MIMSNNSKTSMSIFRMTLALGVAEELLPAYPVAVQ